MSLSVVQDLTKYSRVNEIGEIIFAKKGLLSEPSKSIVFFSGVDIDTAVQSSTYFEFRFQNNIRSYNILINTGIDNMADALTYTNTGTYNYTPSQGFQGDLLARCIMASYLREHYDMIYLPISSADKSFTIEFIAKKASADYDLSVACKDAASSPWITTPSNVYFQHQFHGLVDYGIRNYKLHLRVLTDDQAHPLIKKEVYHTYQTAGTIEKDLIYFKFGEVPRIIRQYMSLDAIQDPYRIHLGNSSRSFTVEYWEEYSSGSQSATTSFRSFLIDQKYATLAGVSLPAQHRDTPIISINNVADKHYIAPGQPAWFSFMLTDEAMAYSSVMQLKMITDQATVYHPDISGSSLNYFYHQNHIIHIPVMLARDTTGIKWITAQIIFIDPGSGEEEIFASRTYYIDYRTFEIDRWFYYLNSLGGIDSIRFLGDSTDTLSFNYFDYGSIPSKERLGISKRYSTHSTQKSKLLSGYLERNQLVHFQDFAHSRFIFEVDRNRMPKATALDEIPLLDNDFARRHSLESMVSHPMLVTSRDLSIPSPADTLLTFSIDIERAYTSSGILHRDHIHHLPALQEDALDFTVAYPIQYKGLFTLNFNGKAANLEVYINGKKIDPSLTIDPSFGQKTVSYSQVIHHEAVSVSIRGNYMRDINISYTDSMTTLGASCTFTKAQFVNLNTLFFETSTNDMIVGLPILYQALWRTLRRLVIYKCSRAEITETLLLAISYRNDNPYALGTKPAPLDLLNFGGSGLTADTVMAACISTLSSANVTVTL